MFVGSSARPRAGRLDVDGPGRVGWAGWVVLGMYYLGQAGARTWTGGGCQLDEAEQLILGQEWHWGYGSQGPLYTWLVAAMGLSTGWEIAGLALLKNCLLFGTHVFVYRVAMEVLRDRGMAWLAAVALFLIPGFVHESQRDQSHLVLATFLGAAWVATLLRVVRLRRPGEYVLLGAIAGAGVLSKYNFVVLLAGVMLAVLVTPAARSAFRGRWTLVAAAMFLLVVGPHLAWGWENMELLTSQSHKLAMGGEGGFWQVRGRVVVRLLATVVGYLPIPAVFLLVLWRWPVPGAGLAEGTTALHLVGRAWILTLALAAVLVVGAGVGGLKVRWFQPVMVLLPVLTVHAVRGCLDAVACRRVAVACGVAAAAGFLAVHGSVWWAGALGRSNNVNVHFKLLADQMREEGFEGGTLISDDKRLAGNLRREWPGTVAVVPNLGFYEVPRDRPAVLVWDAAKGLQPPPELRRFASDWVTDWPCHQPSGVAEAAGLRGDPKVTRVAFLLIPENQLSRRRRRGV